MAALQQQLPWEASRTVWAQQLNPVIANAIVQGNAVTGVMLAANTPKDIPTGLNRTQQGWFLTDINANAIVWRSGGFNSNTLTLMASAACTVDVWMF